MCSTSNRETEQFKTPIELCLHDLDIIRRVTLPDLKVIRMISPLYRPSIISGAASASLQASLDFSPRYLLQQLLDMGSMDSDIKALMWCPVAAHRKLMPEEKIVGFIKRLKEWKKTTGILFHKLGVDEALSEPVNFDLATLANIPMPPPPYAILPKDFCLILALYVFYRMRLSWALSIYSGGESNLELDCYHFTYQLLRFVTTALSSSSASDDIPFGCEALRVGLSPMLFLAGQSCPRPTWLRWILFELDRIGREGVCNNKAFAASLEVLSTLEKRVGREPRRPDVEYFTPPHRRVISVIFPNLNGRGYVTYYAQARPGEEIDSQESHTPLCIARWASSANGGRPAVTTCDGTDVPFSEWVMDQPLVREWAQWLTFSEFDLNQTLHDHINGSRLLLDHDKTASDM
ncbi:uncharacterized protein LDX57_010053 [Aspergillus melleus]|uniref:uncharacterized protein n=1 Tax=Aspergillus melleus TaxID=138277 RepID=UPI001E8D2EC8|nr:uncharacterized protein LDX57_010053 [Aspergillus melleus]KAH8432415.1 hypothetical protein LDX57_010053 [Aspergillus melleus]